MSDNTNNKHTEITFDYLKENTEVIRSIAKAYVAKITNRKIYKPEFDNVFIQKKEVDDIIAVVKISIIESTGFPEKRRTFIFYYNIYKTGWGFPLGWTIDSSQLYLYSDTDSRHTGTGLLCYRGIIDEVLDTLEKSKK